MLKKCEICGKDFETSTNERFCSFECYKQWRDSYENKTSSRTVVCEICGKEFQTQARCAKYCSDECRKKANSNRVKEYHKKHRDQWNAYSREYYQKNADKQREYNRNWYRNNTQKSLEASKCWRKKHPEMSALYNKSYRLRQKAKKCCEKFGGIDNCPYPDCICE